MPAAHCHMVLCKLQNIQHAYDPPSCNFVDVRGQHGAASPRNALEGRLADMTAGVGSSQRKRSCALPHNVSKAMATVPCLLRGCAATHPAMYTY